MPGVYALPGYPYFTRGTIIYSEMSSETSPDTLASVQPDEPDLQRYSLKDVQRNRKRLKRQLAENSLLHFILYDYWKIRKFGAQTGIVTTHFLFRLQISGRIGERLERLITQEIVIPLSARLDVILEKAWLHVNRFEYNLVVLLRRICLEVEKLSFLKLNVSNRHAFEAFRNLEPHFLVFYNKPALVKKLLEVLSYLHDSMDSVKFSQRETRQLVERLLLFDAVRPSLAQTLLSANMIFSRRFLAMTDLIDMVDEPLISDLDYDVDEKTHAAIMRYIDELDKNLAGMYGSYVQMHSQRYFMPRLDPQTPDITILQRFITGKSGPERKGIYSEMYSNIPSYVIDFANAYISAFEALLCKTVSVEDREPLYLFSPLVFSDYFSRLKFNLDQIERMRTQLPYFQILRYLELTKKKSRISSYVEKPGKAETKLLGLLDEHVRLFRDLKEQLYALVAGFAENADLRESMTDQSTDTRGLPTGNEIAFELADSKINSSSWVGGLKVREALRNAVVLINLFLYELHEGATITELEDEVKLRASIQNLIQLAGTLGNADQVQRIRNKYPLDIE